MQSLSGKYLPLYRGNITHFMEVIGGSFDYKQIPAFSNLFHLAPLLTLSSCSLLYFSDDPVYLSLLSILCVVLSRSVVSDSFRPLGL